MDIPSKRIPITGGSNGIGLAAASELISKSVKVFIGVENRTDPASLDERFLALKPSLEAAVKDHNAL